MPSTKHRPGDETTAIVRRTNLSNRSKAGDLIRTSRPAKGSNQPRLAQLLGISKGCITNWENGLSLPSSQVLPKLCALLDLDAAQLLGAPQTEVPELTADERECLTLFRRLGPRDRRTTLSLMTIMSDNAAQDAVESCRRDFIPLPRFVDKVCAGSGNELTSDGQQETCFVRRCPETLAADAIITVTGHSMEPTYADGDQLFISYTDELSPGQVGIFLVNGEGTLKEYRKEGLFPHNPDYEVILPSEDREITCVARVLGTLSSFLLPTEEQLRILTAEEI